MSQTERILRIQQMLQDRGVISRRVFLDELEISLAQFKRDLAFLRDRFQVQIEYDPRKRGYLIAHGEDAASVELPGPMYTAREIHALLIVEDLVKQLQPGLLDEHLKPLRERLKLLLGRRDLPSDEIRKRIRILHMASRPSEPRHFRQVSQATLMRRRLHLRYYNRARDDSTDREISPQRLVYYRGNWYLDAWCHLRNDLRSFAVDAMQKVSMTPTPAQEIETASLDAHLGAGYGIFSGVADKSAILRFEPTAARWVAAERWHAKQSHKLEPTGHLVLTVPYANEPELVMDILRYGADVEVLAPESLRATVSGIEARIENEYLKYFSPTRGKLRSGKDAAPQLRHASERDRLVGEKQTAEDLLRQFETTSSAIEQMRWDVSASLSKTQALASRQSQLRQSVEQYRTLQSQNKERSARRDAAQSKQKVLRDRIEGIQGCRRQVSEFEAALTKTAEILPSHSANVSDLRGSLSEAERLLAATVESEEQARRAISVAQDAQEYVRLLDERATLSERLKRIAEAQAQIAAANTKRADIVAPSDAEMSRLRDLLKRETDLHRRLELARVTATFIPSEDLELTVLVGEKPGELACDSTWLLIQWLRERQSAAGRSYAPPEPPAELAEETNARASLAREMLAQIPAERSDEPERWRVHELLAHLLEFHRREQKSLHWARYERLAMTEQELIDDPDCLGALERTATTPVTIKRSFVYEYRFPIQESKFRAGSKCELVSNTKAKFAIETIDYDRQVLTIKRGIASGPLPDRFSLIPDEIFDERAIVQSIEQTVRRYLETGKLLPALEDFLFRRRPRIHGSPAGPLIQEGEDVLVGAKRLVLGLNQSALSIQGPPGSGKTSKGGQVIAELLKAGKRIGISSNTHDAICELMKSAAEAATKLGLHFTAAKCGEDDRIPFHPSIEIIPDNPAVFQRQTLPDLVGGTAWVFSRPEAQGRFDYLFIDEAGQVSLAKLVGMASSASNLILLGDQMQLSQPIRGVHPGESGTSILDYYLQDHATVPEDLGIFLPKTWRMRPEICSFISNAVYDGRLEHELCTETRTIRLSKAAKYLHRSAGLLYVPVEHEGNTCESDEEVEVVRNIVAELIGQTLEQVGQSPRLISADDILVVAPFNLQVRKLKVSLPAVRVGTVDKFQGQQAPVVIFSMTASDGDASPRGMEFLFDKNRLNVAISRAQMLAVIVASPKLGQTRCVRLEQMQLINLFCRVAYDGSQGIVYGRGETRVA